RDSAADVRDGACGAGGADELRVVLRRFRRTRRTRRAQVGGACGRAGGGAFGERRKRTARAAARDQFEPARKRRRRDSVPELENARSSRSRVAIKLKEQVFVRWLRAKRLISIRR